MLLLRFTQIFVKVWDILLLQHGERTTPQVRTKFVSLYKSLSLKHHQYVYLSNNDTTLSMVMLTIIFGRLRKTVKI